MPAVTLELAQPYKNGVFKTIHTVLDVNLTNLLSMSSSVLILVQSQFGKPLTKLDSWMLKKKTDPELRCAILSRLREWHRGTAISKPDWDSSFKAALRAQNSIGWYPFLLGHVANQWHAVQQAYYTSLGLDNTGRQWV
jgi:hypothetical protein